MPASRQASTTTACLTQVLGDFNETLRDCFQLMDDKSVYATQQGFLYNIQWYIRVKDDVEQLRDRIAFLNIKVSERPLSSNTVNGEPDQYGSYLSSSSLSTCKMLRRPLAAGHL